MVEVSLTAEGLERLRNVPLVHRMPAAIFSIVGPGALQCMQGLLTNDLVKPADGSLVYGAVLTPKGLIVLDCWVIKQDATRFLFIADLDARATVAELFRKQLPPRLAKVTDLTDEWEVYRVLARVQSTRSNPATSARSAAVFARSPAPFAALLTGPRDEVAQSLAELAAEGTRTATDGEWEAARILAGWPRRGAEIDEKTLVQEVRFDENEGVSYEKGCYTGQETVARLHFRGHTNRDLRGLVWADPVSLGEAFILSEAKEPSPTVILSEAPVILSEAKDRLADARILVGEKEVGSVRSVLSLPTGQVALALIRREVETGQVVTAGGLPATVVSLPFPAI